MQRLTILLAATMSLALPAVSKAASAIYADTVVSFVRGPGQTHPNFLDSASALGAPDYSDPSSTGLGVGAVSLGSTGSLAVHMSAGFTIGGTAVPDLTIYEIGPSQGGTAESVNVFISKNGTDWFSVGLATGGTSSLNIDGLGFTSTDVFHYVRVTDVSANIGRPAGADIDAISALNPVPEPSTICLLIFGIAIVFAKTTRRTSLVQTEA